MDDATGINASNVRNVFVRLLKNKLNNDLSRTSWTNPHTKFVYDWTKYYLIVM